MKCYIRRSAPKINCIWTGWGSPALLNSRSCETDPETIVDLKLNVNHLCGVAAKETNRILGHVKRSLILRPGEGAFPPGWLIRPHREHRVKSSKSVSRWNTDKFTPSSSIYQMPTDCPSRCWGQSAHGRRRHIPCMSRAHGLMLSCVMRYFA